MPQRITPLIEAILGFLTISSTFFFGDFIIDLIVGVVVYFASRFLYRAFGASLYSQIKNLFKK